MKVSGFWALGLAGAAVSSYGAVERSMEMIGFGAEPAAGGSSAFVAQIGGIAGLFPSTGPTIELQPLRMLSEPLLVTESGSYTLAARFREDVGGREELVIVSGFSDVQVPLLLPEQIDGYPVTAIGEGAFTPCAGITRVVFPEGMQMIGTFAFAGQTVLRSVTFAGNAPSLGEGAFRDVPAGFMVYHAPDATGFDGPEWDPYTTEVITDGNFHTVEFNLAGKATAGAGEVLRQEVPEGGDALEPRILVDDYWIFTGWDQAFDSVGMDLTVTAQFALDTDKDGVSDVEEELLGTSPEVADSDSDGVDDVSELAFGSDPVHSMSRPQLVYRIVVDAGGNRFLLYSIPVWTGGDATDDGYISSGFRYRFVGSADLENWTKLVVPVENPGGLPDPPADCEWITFRLSEPLVGKSFLRAETWLIRD